VLAHELGNILDGSLRCLGIAERALANPAPASDQGDEARRKLETVRASLERMAEIVDAAMKGAAGSLAPRPLLPHSPIELGEAIFHAVDVLTPAAEEHGIRIKACVSNGLGGVPAGSLYPVVVNGLRNAIEAVAAVGRRALKEAPGTVEIGAEWTEDGRVRIAIRDDGVGPPNAAPEALFTYGFSTKPEGGGIGLAIARSIVDELPEGSLRLFARADRPVGSRPGAILEVVFRPVPRPGSGAA
jgi:signal transduction histidine kinase